MLKNGSPACLETFRWALFGIMNTCHITHLAEADIFCLPLYNATEEIPPIAAVSRTPPMNPPMVAPTVPLTQSQLAKYWGEMEGK